MTASIPPASSRMAMVSAGVSVACLAYAASLVVQRWVPSLKDALGIALEGGIHPTYFLRVGASLALGVLVAAAVGKRAAHDRLIALVTGVAITLTLVLICAFP